MPNGPSALNSIASRRIRLLDARQFPDADDASGGDGEDDAEELHEVEGEAGPARLPDHSGQRPPQPAHRQEQAAGDPDVDAAFEIRGGTCRVTQALAPVRAITLWCSAKSVNNATLKSASPTVVPVSGAGSRSAIDRSPATTAATIGTAARRCQRKSLATNAYYGAQVRGAQVQGCKYGEPRVAITGIGVVSAFGVGREVFWDAIRRGQSGTRAITEFDASTYPCRVAAPVPRRRHLGGEPARRRARPRESRADPKRYSRAALFGVVAAREAWNDAGLSFAEPNAGVIIGSGGGGIDVGERQYQDFFQNNGQHVTPYAIAVGICGMVSSEISIALGLRGISHVLSTGCTSSTDALGYAAMLLRSGECDVLLSGGTDGCVLPGMIFGFSRMRAVSTHYNDCPHKASRPFDKGRDGFVLGEGAWMMALELEDRARARGATDLRHDRRLCLDLRRLSPRADGSGRRADRALHARGDREVRPRAEEIGYINYHGTSTQLNDAIESRCTRLAFGALADRIPGSSTKSMIGHPQGASGAAGVVATALALSRGFLPPTINQTDPDPDCDLDFIPNEGREASPVAALCNCLGFGSKNSALVLGRVRWMTSVDDIVDDVVIAGAGPAGAFAAAILARAGLRVRVFDRARFPRHKLCGDTLNPGALAVLRRHADVATLIASSDPIHGMMLTGPGGVRVRGAYGDGIAGRAITRAGARSMAARSRDRGRRRRRTGGRDSRRRRSPTAASPA